MTKGTKPGNRAGAVKLGNLGRVDYLCGQCPVSELRHTLRHGLSELRNRKDASKFIILVWFWI
jgi:hypothetical protein